MRRSIRILQAVTRERNCRTSDRTRTGMERSGIAALRVPCHLPDDNQARAGRNAPERLRILYLWQG